MSVFTEDGNQTDQTPDDTQTQQTEDWVTRVAQEKGEKFRDPNELAKGYSHAQEHIANLTRQIEEMREDLGKKDYMQEVLDRIDAQKAKPSGGEERTVNTSSTDNQGHKPEVSVEQIKELIAETLTEQEAKNTAAQNLQETDRRLVEVFGTEAKAKVAERASQLGMSNERMKQLAEESPSAFLALMGDAPRKETNQTTKSAVNTAGGFNQTDRKDWSYYQKMRKENSKLYYSPRVQNEMLQQREKLGEAAFYNR